MEKKSMKEIVAIPEGVEVKAENNIISAKGPKGELTRKLIHPRVKIDVEDNSIVITCKSITKREKAIIGTFEAHITNMLKGVKDGHTYKLKICSSHFPMTVAVEGTEFVVKNFFGEKVPRKLKLKQGAEVKIEGENITVESVDKELAGQVAADIESLTKRVEYDRRIFQDGIYIIEKAGREIK